MDFLTLEEKQYIESINDMKRIEETPVEDIILYVRRAIEHTQDAVQIVKWIDKIEVEEFKGEDSEYKDHHCLNFKSRTLVFTYGGYWTNRLHFIPSMIKDWFKDLDIKLENSWISIENALPYKMEDLFYNRQPHKSVRIDEHFSHLNFAYVKTHVRKPQPKKRGRKNADRDVYKEMVIEQYTDREGRIAYKTKIKTYLDQFKEKKNQMTAPKAERIEVNFVERRNRYHFDGMVSDLVKIERVGSKNVVVATKSIDFTASGLVLEKVYTPYVRYNDGKSLWLVIREDKYVYSHNTCEFERVVQFTHDFYYIINEFDGIVEASSIDCSDESAFFNEEPPIMDTIKIKDPTYPVVVPNEDETELIIPDNIEYLTIEKKNWSPDAIEYIVENEKTSYFRRIYYAIYDGKYVQTSPWNPKVSDLIEAAKVLDTLERA